MNLKEKLSTLSRTVEMRIESLDMSVMMRKLTVKEGAEFDRKIKRASIDKNPEKIADMAFEVGSKYIEDDDGPIFAEGDLDLVRDMPVTVCAEIMQAFRKVNQVSETDSAELEKN